MFDNEFNPATIENQEFILKVCDAIRNLKLANVDDKYDPFICFPEKFREFVL